MAYPSADLTTTTVANMLVSRPSPDLNVTPLATQLLNVTTLNDTEHAQYQDFYDNAQFVTGLICYPIICILGLIGNIIIVVVFAQKSMATSTNVYLSALAISDIIKLINDVLYFLTVLLVKSDPPSGNKMYGFLYPYAHFIFNMSVCVSSWLTVSVAVERYILVCQPVGAKGLTTIPRTTVIFTGRVCVNVGCRHPIGAPLPHRDNNQDQKWIQHVHV